jgi:N-dimethylarginine dimethylaminohydrolase
MTEMIKKPYKPSCYSEYDPLRKVILCSPEYMKIREVINETQKVFAKENINTSRAIMQHNALIDTFKLHQIEVILLPPKNQYPEQVFTRDIGFTLGNVLFVARMRRSIRQGEEQILKQWLVQQDISFYQISEGSIEGGDVIIDRDTIWIGDSDRTSVKVIDELRKLLPDFQIVCIPFEEDYLHLDCVFNVISPNEALIFPPAFSPSDLEQFASRYELIEVSSDEQFTLGTNILSIGNKTMVSLPLNGEVNEQLRRRGYTVIEVDISEIIKSGGSFRCITMPLLRE